MVTTSKVKHTAASEWCQQRFVNKNLAVPTRYCWNVGIKSQSDCRGTSGGGGGGEYTNVYMLDKSSIKLFTFLHLIHTKCLGSREYRAMGGLLLAPAKQRVTMTAMYANYIKHHCTYMQLKPFIQLLLNWEAPSQLNYILREIHMNIL